ncbi:hypothetical protein L3X38_017208 [Prunus dulcis]|uniref:RNase H type-1 domain-containing protein n=1 Tax=Prunus dulcis TaxID=3755 RepID=A0AAD4W9C4_PRUDU|nr:hypothetical protein L3X38_017208 [Prunus dulcis]
MIILMVKVCIIRPIFLRGVLSYEESYKSLEEPRACKANQNEIWSCPLEGFYKLNVDGATDNATCLHSIGTVVRNDSGVFMGALAMQNPRRVSILATEFQAICRGVLFAASAGFFPLIIETDFSEDVMMINSKETIWTTFGNIMDDVRDLLMQFS